MPDKVKDNHSLIITMKKNTTVEFVLAGYSRWFLHCSLCLSHIPSFFFFPDGKDKPTESSFVLNLPQTLNFAVKRRTIFCETPTDAQIIQAFFLVYLPASVFISSFFILHLFFFFFLPNG